MTIHLGERGIRVLLLDIEGTTTPVTFVHDVLFPYARARLQAFINRYATTPQGREWLDRLHEEWRADLVAGDPPTPWPDAGADEARASAADYCVWLMDRDRKSPALKALQGLIWQEGYEAGVLRSNVFPDVPVAFDRWRRAGVGIAIYSSGSVLAQKLLFGASAFGDLTPFIDQFFDTAVGPKTSPESYRRISAALGRRPAELLFVSDVAAEIDVARGAGLHVALSVRPGNPPQPTVESAIVRSFDEVVE